MQSKQIHQHLFILSNHTSYNSYRLQGLLRSEALKDVDKPVWYEVYEAFPPKVPPVYERPLPQREVPKILYPEDVIRVYVRFIPYNDIYH